MTQKEIFKIVAKRYGYNVTFVENFFNLWITELRKHIKKFEPFTYDYNKKTDINMPYLGKLIINQKRVMIYNENHKNNTAEHTDSDDSRKVQRNRKA